MDNNMWVRRLSHLASGLTHLNQQWMIQIPIVVHIHHEQNWRYAGSCRMQKICLIRTLLRLLWRRVAQHTGTSIPGFTDLQK